MSDIQRFDPLVHQETSVDVKDQVLINSNVDNNEMDEITFSLPFDDGNNDEIMMMKIPGDDGN